MSSSQRKPSQSVYQNKSVMSNGKFTNTLEGSGLMGKSGLLGSCTFVTDDSEEN